MPEEKRDQRGIVALEASTDHEGEKSRQQQTDDDEHISDRRGEIAREFALGDGPDVCPGAHFFSSFAVSGIVMLRNTSSSRPSSVCISSILQPCAASAMLCASAPLAATLTPPVLGITRAVTPPASSFTMTTFFTVESCDSFWFNAAEATPFTRNVTAPAHSDFCRSCCGVPLATILPRSIMIAREHTASTSSRMCVEKMIAFFSPILRIRERTSCFWLGSR